MDVNDTTGDGDGSAAGPPAPLLAAGVATVAAAPPNELRFKRRMSFVSVLRDMWRAREVTRSLAERTIRSRYKQAVLGFAWSILTPLILMVAFAVLFQKVGSAKKLGLPPGVPYELASYVALVPWTFFSNAISNGAVSIVSNITLINKVPCPREVFPLSGVVVAGFDAVLSLIALVVLFVIYAFAPHRDSYWVPLIVAIIIAFTTGASILAAVLVVYIRDLRTALPLALQFGLFVTPIGYGFSVIPERFRAIYSVINPLGPTIDALRRTVLQGIAPQTNYLALAAAGSAVYLIGGYWLFKRMEAGIADIT
jgi:ABC-type polysaccharide/polyol phosphate export permease